MKITMSICIVILLGISHAFAADPISRMDRYASIEVVFSEGAANCNITQQNALQKKMENGLKSAGIKRDSSSRMLVRISVTAQSSGLLKSTCLTQLQVSFQTVLKSAEIKVENSRIRQLLDELQVLPVILYQNGRMAAYALSEPSGGGKSTTAAEGVSAMLDEIIADIAKIRAG